MPRQLISSGSSFETEIGYSRAAVVDDWVFVSGTTGFDYATMTIADDLVAQTEQCLQNIVAALAQAGATTADVVRVTYVLPPGNDFSVCWPTLRRYFGEVRPATLISMPAPISAEVEGSGTAAALLTSVRFTFRKPPF